jgi:hypothetical protein
MPQHKRIARKKKPSGTDGMDFCTKTAAHRDGGLPLSCETDLAVHAAVLATLSALSRLLLAALMLLTGLSLSALLLLAGLALAALLGIALLLLVARILLFVRHVDVLHQFSEAPRATEGNPRDVAWFLAWTLELWATDWKIKRKCGSNDRQAPVSRVAPEVPDWDRRPLCRTGSAC